MCVLLSMRIDEVKKEHQANLFVDADDDDDDEGALFLFQRVDVGRQKSASFRTEWLCLGKAKGKVATSRREGEEMHFLLVVEIYYVDVRERYHDDVLERQPH